MMGSATHAATGPRPATSVRPRSPTCTATAFVVRSDRSSGSGRSPTKQYPYAACFTDGAASASGIVRTGEVRSGGSANKVVLAPHLVCKAAATLRIIGRHALRTGARGDAIIGARVFGPHALLGWDHNGLTEAYSSMMLVKETRSEPTLPLDALGGAPQDLLAATRLMLTTIFNGFGCPEVPQIAPDGTVRTRFFPANYKLAEWAKQRGVATSDVQVLE